MQHTCTLAPVPDSVSIFFDRSCFRKMRKSTVICAKHPQCVKYFRSEQAVKKERNRQIHKSKPWVIHPLSKFRIGYEMYLIALYMTNLIQKPAEAAFVLVNIRKNLYQSQFVFSCVLNFFNYIDIIMNFITGYLGRGSYVELRPNYIARHYVSSILFYSDVLSSFPRFYGLPNFTLNHLWYASTLNVLCLLKIFRLPSLIRCIHNTADYFRWNIRDRLLLMYSILITIIIVHWMTCLQCLIPMFGYHYWYSNYSQGLYEEFKRQPTFSLLYKAAFLKTSAEILGVRNDAHDASSFPLLVVEDYIIAMLTYLLGKIIMTSIWIILAMSIMSKRSTEIKYVEIINQLEAYMALKGFPMNLREKIFDFYQFKFQNKFFKEKYVHELLSNELHKEVDIHLCSSLISSVYIFSQMTNEQISELVPKLTSEIFLPRETIIRAGVAAEHMYFVATGTVAAYTHSGKEVCHIEDGGYFNDIPLLTKGLVNMCTFVSLEMTKVYRLSTKDFDASFAKFPDLFDTLLEQALLKLKIIKKLEADYKKEQFEQQFGRQGTQPAIARQSSISSRGSKHSRSRTVIFSQARSTFAKKYKAMEGYKGFKIPDGAESEIQSIYSGEDKSDG